MKVSEFPFSSESFMFVKCASENDI